MMNAMKTVYDENTIKEFVAENRDHLEEIEPDLLAMERSDEEIDPEIVNRVFRAIHSIKGSSGFFRFNSIKELSHVMESVLMRFREGDRPTDSSGIDALLAGVDKLRIMFADAEKSDLVPYQAELDRLNALLQGPRSESRPKAAPPNRADTGGPGEAPPAEGGEDETLALRPPEGFGTRAAVLDGDTEPAVREALESGLYVYVLWIPESDASERPQDLEERMADFGRCVTRYTPEPDTGEEVILFATVMETDLLCEALGLCQAWVAPLELGGTPRDETEKVSREIPAPAPSPAFTPEPSCPETAPAAGAPPGAEKGLSYETIRVPVDVIDKLMNLAGELVLGRNQLRQELDEAVLRNPKLAPLIQGVDVVTSEVQERIVQMRMQPLGNLFNRFSRLVRDTSRQLQKEVDLVLEGREVELDKSILEGLSDPIIHLLRNGLDHGIEDPETRKSLGKPRKGAIHLRAFHEGGQVNITLRDDGRGIHPEHVADKAVAQGLVSPEEIARMTPKEKINLVLTPGFSTAESVSEISGRGVGMDVVKTNIERLGGHLDINSEAGIGSVVQIRLPLTLAIIPSLIVGAEGHRFAIPQANVKELVCVRAADVSQRIEEIAGAEVLRLRERLLPVVRLSDVLDLSRSFIHPATGEAVTDRRSRLLDRRHRAGGAEERETERRSAADRRQSWHSDLYVVVLKLGENRFGLCVDQLFDTEEIVVKPLSHHIKNVKCFAGATIMGDGRVAMILDAAGIAERRQLRFSEIGAEEQRRRNEEEVRREQVARDRRSILLFNVDPGESFALPLERIARLEKVSRRAVHRVGDQAFMDYRGESLPLIRVEDFLPVSPLPEEEDELYVIVPKSKGARAGILVSRILDILETTADVHDHRRQPGLTGTSFLGDRMTLFLDVEELLTLFEQRRDSAEVARQGGAR